MISIQVQRKGSPKALGLKSAPTHVGDSEKHRATSMLLTGFYNRMEDQHPKQEG